MVVSGTQFNSVIVRRTNNISTENCIKSVSVNTGNTLYLWFWHLTISSIFDINIWYNVRLMWPSGHSCNSIPYKFLRFLVGFLAQPHLNSPNHAISLQVVIQQTWITDRRLNPAFSCSCDYASCTCMDMTSATTDSVTENGFTICVVKSCKVSIPTVSQIFIYLYCVEWFLQSDYMWDA